MRYTEDNTLFLRGQGQGVLPQGAFGGKEMSGLY